jgi:phosphonate transport system substrate-binding protein
MNFFARAVSALILATALLLTVPARADEPYTFAVVPQFDARKLFAIWNPIVEELKRRSGVDLRLVATLSIGEFEREVTAGTFDFVYSNPYHVMVQNRRQGYLPLVRDTEPLRGILVVPKDSPVQRVEDLAGKVLAVPSPNAVGASLLIRADLERLHGIRMTMLNAKTHSSAYVHAANMLADAAGGVEKTLREQPAGVRDALRVLYTTRELPSHPVAAHPRVPADARARVQAAFLAMAATAGGGALLAAIPMVHAVPAASDDYKELASWGLESYWVEGPR